MKKLFFLIGFLLTATLSFAQEDIEFKEYSYTELFQMIEDEQDSVFTLSNAIIKFNEATDQRFLLNPNINSKIGFTSLSNDSIRIDKSLKLNNIDFILDPNNLCGIGKVIFTRPMECTNCINLLITQTSFKSTVAFNFNYRIQTIKSFSTDGRSSILFIVDSKFQSGLLLRATMEKKVLQFLASGNYLNTNEAKNEGLRFFGTGFSDFGFNNNIVEGTADVVFSTDGVNIQNNNNERLFNFEIRDNTFNVPATSISFDDKSIDYVKISGNQWPDVIKISTNELDRVNTFIEGSQLIGKLVDEETYFDLFTLKYLSDSVKDMSSAEQLAFYRSKLMVEDVYIYNSEVALRGLFKDYFDSRHDAVSANLFYVEIKDLETRRMAYLYRQAPSFDRFFKWRINQFLKLFSAYGTEPAKAITFSVYVIVAFALIYLFFPNYWDSHGKNRIMDRYRFFLKYVNRDSGIHEVYLEEQKQDLLNAENFKTYLLEQGKTAPKFFMATAMPLYRWSVAGTQTFSWLLSKVDVLKGKWSDTEESKRGLKTVLLISAFLVALTYDILIKMLNALMLSINTFTTLGFGEIPIKGLPRYLAIIQGFIGWFMLTIFSVSLISQLLN